MSSRRVYILAWFAGVVLLAYLPPSFLSRLIAPAVVFGLPLLIFARLVTWLYGQARSRG